MAEVRQQSYFGNPQPHGHQQSKVKKIFAIFIEEQTNNFKDFDWSVASNIESHMKIETCLLLH